jgi:hypothetical protein
MSSVSTSLEVDRPVLSILMRMSPQDMEAVIPAQVRQLRDTATESGLQRDG